VSPAKTAEPIEMPFGGLSRVGQRSHVLDGGADPQGEGAIYGACGRMNPFTAARGDKTAMQLFVKIR